MKAKHIMTTLRAQFNHSKVTAENIFYYDMWEADFLYVSKTLWVSEVEVKVYRHDFVRDKDKERKYSKLLHGGSGLKRFYYAAPVGMLQVSEIPSFAGLIECYGLDSRVVKRAPTLKNAWKYSDRLDEKIKKMETQRYLKKFENRKL